MCVLCHITNIAENAHDLRKGRLTRKITSLGQLPISYPNNSNTCPRENKPSDYMWNKLWDQIYWIQIIKEN